MVCLRNSTQFRKRFVNLCATRLSIQSPRDEPQISTQVVPPKVQLAKVRARSLAPLKRAQFDVELRFLLPKALRIVIESKVDSPVKAKQLQGYSNLLEQTNDPKGHLLLLVSSAKRIPVDSRAVRKFYGRRFMNLPLRKVVTTIRKGKDDRRSFSSGSSSASFFIPKV